MPGRLRRVGVLFSAGLRPGRLPRWALALLLAALLAGFATEPTRAATVTVTNTSDSGAGSLRQAIANAAAGDTITFSLSGCPCTITLTSGELAITKNLTIQGPGAGALTISGNNASRVFNVASGVTATISGLTIANGNSGTGGVCTSGGLPCNGGGIYNAGALTMHDAVITGSRAFFEGGGIENIGTLTVHDAVIASNRADGDGGGIKSRGPLTIDRTTIRDNQAANGSGIYTFSGNLTMSDSALTGNRGFTIAAALELASTGNLSNTTVGGNSGRGILVAGRGSPSVLNCLNCTITGNTVDGIQMLASSSDATAQLKNTLVANNGVNFSDRGISGGFVTVTSQGNNLDSDGSSGSIFRHNGFVNGVNGDIVGTSTARIDARVGPLASNGGPTQTQALLPGSPALDAGTNTGAPAADQRGIARPQNGTVDIGAFEARAFALTITGGNNQSAPTTTPFATPLGVMLTEGTNPLQGATITYTGPASGAGITPVSGAATDAAGKAARTVTANAIVGGPYTVAATIGALTQSFSLTNTPTADLAITVTSGTAVAGTTTTYTIVASNSGPNDVTGATVTGTFPAALTGVTWTCTGTSGGTCPASGTGTLGAAVTLPVGGVVTFTVTATIAPSAAGTLTTTATVTPPAGATDLTPANNAATATVTIDHAPVANADRYTMTKGTTLTVTAASGVLANDTDADGDPLTVATPRPTSGPSTGSLTLNADGSFTYTPPASYVGPVTFTYTATDGTAASAAATVTIQVQYAFTGFFAQVQNPGPDPAHPVVNYVNAGGTVSLSFSLGGDQGLDILTAASPASQQVDCTTFQPVSGATGTLVATSPAGTAGLTYDSRARWYTYGWVTVGTWANTCRRFVLRLIDGTEHVAYFHFIH